MMIEGKNPLSLPAYTGALPAVLMIRCVCGQRYAVFTGAVVAGDGCDLVKARANAGGQRFVDARVEPFVVCECGQALDFMPMDAGELVM